MSLENIRNSLIISKGWIKYSIKLCKQVRVWGITVGLYKLLKNVCIFISLFLMGKMCTDVNIWKIKIVYMFSLKIIISDVFL